MAFETNLVTLVNEADETVSTMEKMAAHREGILHRAISVFILNDKKEMLLQQRALGKYHSGGLWSNTCCTHPYPGEDTQAAAHRRLKEELGFDTVLKPMFTFRYRSDVGNDLIENEFDHIFLGYYNEAVHFNKEEVMAYKYLPLTEVDTWLGSAPLDFTAWFRLAYPEFLKHLPHHISSSRFGIKA